MLPAVLAMMCLRATDPATVQALKLADEAGAFLSAISVFLSILRAARNQVKVDLDSGSVITVSVAMANMVVKTVF